MQTTVAVQLDIYMQCGRHTLLHPTYMHAVHSYIDTSLPTNMHNLEVSISGIFVFPESGFPFSKICGIIHTPRNMEVQKFRTMEITEIGYSANATIIQDYVCLLGSDLLVIIMLH